jgi:iron complex outermembrane receptor protein
LTPIRGLNLSSDFGYTDARYTKLEAGAAVEGLSLSNRFPNTSRYNSSFTGSYTWELASQRQFVAFGQWTYRSNYFLDAVNSPLIHQSGFSMFNAGGTLSLAHNISIEAGGKNLGDQHYLIAGNVDLSGLGYAEGTYAAPRTWYLTLRYKF